MRCGEISCDVITGSAHQRWSFLLRKPENCLSSAVVYILIKSLHPAVATFDLPPGFQQTVLRQETHEYYLAKLINKQNSLNNKCHKEQGRLSVLMRSSFLTLTGIYFFPLNLGFISLLPFLQLRLI